MSPETKRLRAVRPRNVTASRLATVASIKGAGLATRVHERIKGEIFDFRLMPGDRFSESAVAGRMQVSRTPVREALYRLESEGYLEVMFRSGWRVRPFDFQMFENLYDVRVVLEVAALRRLCEMSEQAAAQSRSCTTASEGAHRGKQGPGTQDHAAHAA